MAQSICPKCGVENDSKKNRKPQPITLFCTPWSIHRDHEQFDLVVCYSCGKEFHSNEIKMFGLFPRNRFWVPYCFLFALFILMLVFISAI
ncbi:hypothetical protein [Amphritea japonica]|uniref:hypothetical protein n=1 Tax=Amphritea japonica TaxID=452627 RepID=UPI001B7FD0D2|nr:hypothetical protein [Amphritea japonica]